MNSDKSRPRFFRESDIEFFLFQTQRRRNLRSSANLMVNFADCNKSLCPYNV